MANYRRELRMGVNLRRRGKIEKATEVCRKNEKGTKRSRSGFKGSTRRNEMASRQRK